MKDFRVSLIIPAYNEENTIVRSLKNLTSSKQSFRLEIIVVCNGCTDRTETFAREFGPDVIVLSTAVPSKTKAINIAEKIARFYPIFYIDSDIIVSVESILGVAEYMQKKGILAASPKKTFALPKKKDLIHRYYEIWTDVQTHNGEMIGSGIYGVSEAGRKRFDNFPDVINDDTYFSIQFKAKERKIVELFSFTIFPPKNIIDLIRIKTRTKIGNILLKQSYPELFQNKEPTNRRYLLKSISNPGKTISILVYIMIRLAVSLNSYRLLLMRKQIPWFKDESSRV